MNARFSLGIDLGTSNSAIAVGDIESGDTRIVEIAQILAPNQLREMPTLPSAIYIPHREEFPEGSFPLPWNDAGEPAIIGQFARERGALVPDRLVTSAKSWLSNPHIDPKQRILPWRSDIAEEKLSPLECSRCYLQHLRDALLYPERAQVQTTATLGLLLSLTVVLVCRQLIDAPDFAQWGWRVPFLLSLVLLAISVYIRMKLNESPVFRRMEDAGTLSRAPLQEEFRQLGQR